MNRDATDTDERAATWQAQVQRDHESRKDRIARLDSRADERQWDLEVSDRWANAPIERPRLAPARKLRPWGEP